jgi:hypothetical protein
MVEGEWICAVCEQPIRAHETTLVVGDHDAHWTMPAFEGRQPASSRVYHRRCAPLVWRHSSPPD